MALTQPSSFSTLPEDVFPTFPHDGHSRTHSHDSLPRQTVENESCPSLCATLTQDPSSFSELSPTKTNLMGLSLCLGQYFEGWYIAVFNPLNFPLFFNRAYDIPLEDTTLQSQIIGNLNMLMALGALFGVFGAGMLSEAIGRRKCLYLMDLGALLVGLGYLCDVKVLFFGYLLRVLTGLTIG